MRNKAIKLDKFICLLDIECSRCRSTTAQRNALMPFNEFAIIIWAILPTLTL